MIAATTMTTVDPHERYLIACHEMGHGVAAVVRGGTFDSICIEPTLRRDGVIHVQYPSCHRDFVTIAGPWADARADWGALPLDGVDSIGHTFDDYLKASMHANASDLRVYEPDRDLPLELLTAEMWGGEAPEIPLARDESWYAELETLWPTMESTATMLLRGVEVTPDVVTALLADSNP
jgi:hypothetical protein